MECAVDRVSIPKVVQPPHRPPQLNDGVYLLVRIVPPEVLAVGNLDPYCDESYKTLNAGTSVELETALLCNNREAMPIK